MAKLNDIEIDDYYASCIELDTEALSEEYARMPGDYGYWNEKIGLVSQKLLLAEWEEEQLESKLYLIYKEGDGKGTKAPTEAAVKAAIVTNPQYGEAHLKTIQLRAEEKYLKGVLETLRTKREMLISAGAQRRQEDQADYRMMEKRAMDRRQERGFDEG